MSDKLSFDEKVKLVEQGKIDKKTGKFTSMDAMREAKGFKPGETAAQFNKRRTILEGAKKTLKASKYGKIAAGIAGAGLALKQYLKSKTNKDEKDFPKDPIGPVDKKSMGGDMKKGYGQARTSGMGLQDENVTLGKGSDYIKDLL
jgi:hypothetical protein